jgi:hypothetical protein
VGGKRGQKRVWGGIGSNYIACMCMSEKGIRKFIFKNSRKKLKNHQPKNGKENTLYMYNGMLFSHKNNEIMSSTGK